MTDAISAIRLESPETSLRLDPVTPPARTDFASMLGTGLHTLNASLGGADSALRAYAAGDGPSTADLMVTMSEARIQLQFAVEVRNRIVDAYQNLTNMQI
jgi:flagellar hook-basal body complex protein FliE